MLMAGRLRYPYFHIDFSSAGDIAANDFFSPSTVIFAKDTSQTRAYLEAMAPNIQYTTSTNYFVVFSEEATSEQMAAYREETEKNCYILSYQEILDATDERIEDSLSTCVPLPAFLLFLSTVSLFSISVIIIYRKASENSIWYLCGCSRRRGMGLVFACIGILGVIASLLNALFIVLYPVLGDYGILSFPQFYVDRWSLLPIVGYMLLTLLVVFVTSLMLQRQASPLELLRRLDQ